MSRSAVHSLCLCLCLCLSLATTALVPVHAQSLPPGFDSSGTVKLEYLSGDGFDETVLFADLDFGYRATNGFSGPGWGFDLGIDLLAFDDDHYSAFYPALVFPLGPGEVSVGVPRGAISRYFPDRNIGTSRFVGLEYGGVGTDVLSTAYLLGDVDIYGLRYDASLAQARVSGSIHRVEESGDGTVFQLAGDFEVPNGRLMFGLERIDADGEDGTNVSVGADLTFGQVDLGVTLTRSDFFGGTGTILFADLRYNISDLFTVSASVVNFDSDFNSDTLYGLGVEYGVTSAVTLMGGVVSDGDNDLWTAGIGMSF